MDPWNAEFSLSPTEARTLIETQFPTLAIQTFQMYGEGWDNYAFIINNAYIFRFPRRQLALNGFQTELDVLNKLSPKLPLNIPNLQYIGSPSSHFPYPFAGYPFLSGTIACHVNLTREIRCTLAAPLANFLKKTASYSGSRNFSLS